MVFLYNVSPQPFIRSANDDDGEKPYINTMQMDKKISTNRKLKQLTPANRQYLIALGFKINKKRKILKILVYF